MKMNIPKIMTRLRLFIEVQPFRLKVENIQIKQLKKAFWHHRMFVVATIYQCSWETSTPATLQMLFHSENNQTYLFNDVLQGY